MPSIRIEQKNAISIIKCEPGSKLLKVLHDNGFDIYSPCGGKGSCGKCEVHFKGLGEVCSCMYHVTEDIELILPEKREAKVLVDQHIHTTPVVTAAGDEVLLSAKPYGVAIDLGTTTLAFHIANLKTGSLTGTRAAVNPQVKFGADVISRITHTSQAPGGLQEMQMEIIKEINQQLKELSGFFGIKKNDIVKITVAGNTTMLHMLLGIDPLPLALVPFKPAFTDRQIVQGHALGLFCNPEARIHILPSIAAYIGADIVAGIASIKPSPDHRNFLFIDIGTNGEMALITPERIWCCSTAAGPAFEGARISCGMSAVEGAISSWKDNEYNVIGNTQPHGLCGSGLVDVVAWMITNNVVNDDGLMQEDFQVSAAHKKSPGVFLTQQDIRELQLAKAALRAGIEGLLRKAQMKASDLDALFLAGGFGCYIDIPNAVKIGMLPVELADKTISLGNTSATGAFLSLISESFDEQLEEVRRRALHFELADDEEFMLDFVMNMSFSSDLG